MSRSFPIQPERVEVVGIHSRVRFLATIKHGKGRRQVAVDVPPEVILRLAACIEATADGACDGKHYRFVRDAGERYVTGHAVWHYDRPEQPMPCIDHSTVIDMQALPGVGARDGPGLEADVITWYTIADEQIALGAELCDLLVEADAVDRAVMVGLIRPRKSCRIKASLRGKPVSPCCGSRSPSCRPCSP